MSPVAKLDNILEAINDAQVAIQKFRETIVALKGLSSDVALEYPVVKKRSEAFKNQLIAVLNQEGGNRTKVAKRYGVTRRTIYRWMKEYGLDTKKECKL